MPGRYYRRRRRTSRALRVGRQQIRRRAATRRKALTDHQSTSGSTALSTLDGHWYKLWQWAGDNSDSANEIYHYRNIRVSAILDGLDTGGTELMRMAWLRISRHEEAATVTTAAQLLAGSGGVTELSDEDVEDRLFGEQRWMANAQFNPMVTMRLRSAVNKRDDILLLIAKNGDYGTDSSPSAYLRYHASYEYLTKDQ